MEFSISSLLALILLWDSLCVKSKTAAHSDIYQRNSQESLETLMGSQINRLQVRPENSVHIHPGQKLTLQCGGEGDEGEQHKNTRVSFYSMLEVYHLIPFSSLLNAKLLHFLHCSVDCIRLA